LQATAGGSLGIDDEIESSREHHYTEFIHSDTTLARRGERQYEIVAGKARLEAIWEAPSDGEARIEPNVVTAPGQPGSVSEGEAQTRGERLALTTARPATAARFRWELKVPLDK
jgi:hypothetical protein